MSVLMHPSPNVGDGSSGAIAPSARGRWRRRVAALLVAMLTVAGLATLPAPAAQAASLGPHFDQGLGWLGAYVAESDGRQVYCLDAGAPSPVGTYTSGPFTVTSLTSHTGSQLSASALAQLNYVTSRWGDSSDRHIAAAVQMFVWSLADAVTYNSHGMSGDNWYIGRVPSSSRPTVLANLATMRAEAAANALVNPVVDVEVSLYDQFNGSITVSVSNVLTGNVVLTNARFLDGTTSKGLGSGTYPIIGTPPSGAPSYQVAVSAAYSAPGIGTRVNVYTTPGAQRLMTAGTPAALTDSASSPVIPLDFQPVIATQVAAKFVDEGEPFIDELLVETIGTGDWIIADGTIVPLTATGTLYGPFDEQPAESEEAPEDASVVGMETLLLDSGTGTYVSAGTLTAAESGFYTWVWEIDKVQQGESAQYIRDSFRDWFGRMAETHVSPFQPVALSRADARLAVPGDAVTDTLTVSSENGAWLRIDGEPIPVTFTGTAYRVPGVLPPVEQAGVPSDAVPLGTVELTATGPGVYTSPAVVLPEPGFVTWVWEVRLEAQSTEYRDYLADSWADNYGVPLETTSVRHPVSITSELREYNIHLNGRAFDTITVSGFPADHGYFAGDGYWGADLDEIRHTVYGPFATDAELTDDLDLATAPVLTVITTPARNGEHRIGYTDADRIQPSESGYYVVVSAFEGDDRAQPFRSSPADVLERFFVPGPPVPGVDVQVSTQAQPEAFVGEDFADIAAVTGTNIPTGTYLVFRAYGPFEVQPGPGEEGEPFFVSEPIPVTGPGEYASGPTSVDRPGLVFWVETLYTGIGEVLTQGWIGAPGETTVVTERPTGPPPENPEPPVPPKLAQTGGGDWLLPGLGGLGLLSLGGTLLFGRRLALWRERMGHVREEDLMTFDEFEALFQE